MPNPQIARGYSKIRKNTLGSCAHEMPFVSLDLGPGFLLCSPFQCCSLKSLCNGFRGSMLDLIFFLYFLGCFVSFQGSDFVAKSIHTEVWSQANGLGPKDSNRWGILKIEKLQRLFETLGMQQIRQTGTVGGTEDRKATNAIVDPACLFKACK